MKKTMKITTVFFIFAIIGHNVARGKFESTRIPVTPRSIIEQKIKNDRTAELLKRNLEATKQKYDQASTKEERQARKKELQQQFDQTVNFLDRTQNMFFGMGKIAAHKKEQAEKRLPILEQKLNEEIQNYLQLTRSPASPENEKSKQASLKRQLKLKEKITIEMIALGKISSFKQKSLYAATAAAGAALGIVYVAPIAAAGSALLTAKVAATAGPMIAGAATLAGDIITTPIKHNIEKGFWNIITEPFSNANSDDTPPISLIIIQQFNPEEMMALGFRYNQQHNLWLTSTNKLILGQDEKPYKAIVLPPQKKMDEAEPAA